MARRQPKLTKGTWTRGDLSTLKRLFGNNTTAHVAEVLGRPLDATKKKASRMGLRKTHRHMKTLGRS